MVTQPTQPKSLVSKYRSAAAAQHERAGGADLARVRHGHDVGGEECGPQFLVRDVSIHDDDPLLTDKLVVPRLQKFANGRRGAAHQQHAVFGG